jgi:hypothetical protein
MSSLRRAASIQKSAAGPRPRHYQDEATLGSSEQPDAVSEAAVFDQARAATSEDGGGKGSEKIVQDLTELLRQREIQLEREREAEWVAWRQEMEREREERAKEREEDRKSMGEWQAIMRQELREVSLHMPSMSNVRASSIKQSAVGSGAVSSYAALDPARSTSTEDGASIVSEIVHDLTQVLRQREIQLEQERDKDRVEWCQEMERGREERAKEREEERKSMLEWLNTMRRELLDNQVLLPVLVMMLFARDCVSSS